MIFAFISLIFNKISGIKIGQVTIFFRNSVVVNQLVMNKNKPLDQMRSTGVNAPNRTSKLVNTRVRDKNLMIFNQSKDIEYWAAFQGRLIYLYSLVLLIPEDKLPA